MDFLEEVLNLYQSPPLLGDVHKHVFGHSCFPEVQFLTLLSKKVVVTCFQENKILHFLQLKNNCYYSLITVPPSMEYTRGMFSL